MLQLPPDFEQMANIFHPFMIREWHRVNSEETKFVHYTTAEAATNIVRSGQVWMRNTSCMNDFSEVEHGVELLTGTWKSPIGQHLKKFLMQFLLV